MIGILSNKDSFVPVANPDEVDTVFDAPLEMFLKVLYRYFKHPISYLHSR